MSLASRRLGVVMLCVTAVVGFELGWQGRGNASDGGVRTAQLAGPSASRQTEPANRATDARQDRVARGRPTVIKLAEPAPDPRRPAQYWVAYASHTFERDGRPGRLLGPASLDAGASPRTIPQEVAEGSARLWLVQGEDLWWSSPAANEPRWDVHNCEVGAWLRLEGRSRRDGSVIAVQPALASGLPVPRVAGRTPILNEQMLAASLGFVPADITAEQAVGDALSVTLDPAAKLRGSLRPPAAPGSRLWLELAGGAGALDLELDDDGSFGGELVPEGFHILHLEAENCVLGYYGGIGARVRAPETDLGVVLVCRSGTLTLDVDPAVDGPLYLLAYEPGHRPAASEFLSRRVFTGERLGDSRWRFRGVRAPFAGGWLWSEDGSEAEFAERVLARDGQKVVSRVRLVRPGSCRLRFVSPGADKEPGSWAGWSVLATPASLGKADALWLRFRERKPWLPVRQAMASADGRVQVAGLSRGTWWLAALTPSGRVVGKRSASIEGSGAIEEGGPWAMPSLGSLDIVPPRCERHPGVYRLRIEGGGGVRPVRRALRSNASQALTVSDLPAGAHGIQVTFAAARTRNTRHLNLGDLAPERARVRRLSALVPASGRTRIELGCVACTAKRIPEHRAPALRRPLVERVAPIPQPEKTKRRR